jgi:epoxyqueuosine reductase QueG
MANATRLVRDALEGAGVELVASCSAEAYDAAAPPHLRASTLVPGARGVVVAASAGPALWRAFRERTRARPESWDDPHPYDRFVGELLARADAALAAAGVQFARFEAAARAPVRVSFVALGRLAALGAPGPFGLLIHPVHGPWWALRGAWVVDSEVEPAAPLVSPCTGCVAPCVGGWERAGGILSATVEARSLCVVGQASRYDEDQIGYHYDRARTVTRLRAT